MVQDFSLRYPLDRRPGKLRLGRRRSARRRTATPKSRLMPIAMEMLADIDKNTVDFVPNFDDRARGADGSAGGHSEPRRQRLVGHRGRHGDEHSAAQPARGRQRDRPPDRQSRTRRSGDLRKFIKGPDFPTGGYIYGRAGIKDYQETGRGRIVMRARAVIEEKESSNKSQIVVTEIPVSGQQREARSRTSPSWCATRSSRASPTCGTSPTATACAS